MIQMKLIVIALAVLLSCCEVFPDSQVLVKTARSCVDFVYSLVSESADMETVENTSDRESGGHAVTEESEKSEKMDSEAIIISESFYDDIIQFLGAVIKLLAVVIVLLLILIGAVVGYFIVKGLPG